MSCRARGDFPSSLRLLKFFPLNGNCPRFYNRFISICRESVVLQPSVFVCRIGLGPQLVSLSVLTAVLKWSVHTFFPTSLFLFLGGVAVDFSSSLDALDLSARTSSLLWNSGGPMVWRSAVVVYGGGGVLRYDLSVVAF